MQLREVHSGFVAHFRPVPLRFVDGARVNIFAGKNNKSLGETLRHPRYAKLKSDALIHCAGDIDSPLGEVLLGLKLRGNLFYKRFLNAHGDLTYSEFRISDASAVALSGIYAYVIDDRPIYIGRCLDSMGKRVDQGYGNIHPKNCYIDGQSTNCRINAAITKAAESVRLWLCPLTSRSEIESGEFGLIRSYRPAWNVQGC